MSCKGLRVHGMNRGAVGSGRVRSLGVLFGLAVTLTLVLVTASSVFAAAHIGTIQPGGGTISFAGGDVTVKAPDGATSSAVDIAYSPETADSISIVLSAEDANDQSGSATLTAQGGATEVIMELSQGTLQSEAVHIHNGSCDKREAPGTTLGGVDWPLTFFVGGAGSSVSTVPATLSEIRDGNHAINAHKAGEPGIYTACGNIPGERPAPEGKIFGSQIFTLGVMQSGVLQDSFSFKQFVQVTVKYSAADKAAAAGNRDDNIALYTFDVASGGWIEIASALPNVIDQSFNISQLTLGTYALVITTDGAAPAAPTPAPQETTAPPDTGDFGVSTGMMLVLGLVGAFFVLGGGYMIARGRNS